jgi:hypothetical protein
MILIYTVDYGTLEWFDELNRRTIPLCYIDNVNTFTFFFYRQHIHHITCTEQDKHITSVNDSYCYLCAQHITIFFFLKKNDQLYLT